MKEPSRHSADVLTPDALRQAGFSEEQRADIQSATSEEEFQAKIEAQWKKRTPENIAAGKAEIEAAADAAKNEGAVAFDGTNFNVTDPEGNLILSTPDADAAAIAAADIKSSRELEDLAEVRSMIAFYERDNMEQGRQDDAQRFEQTGEDPKLSDSGESFSKLMERMQIEGLAPDTDPRTVSILGENIGELKNGIFSDLVKLHQRANAMTVVHERIDGETKRAIAEGRRSRDWFIKNVQQTEGALGESLLVTDADGRVSDQAVVEAVTKLGEAYFAGRVRDDRLPPGLRRFFREMVQYFKELFRRAGRMRKAILEEKISGDFVEYLADQYGNYVI
jgi:hypothetical protein